MRTMEYQWVKGSPYPSSVMRQKECKYARGLAHHITATSPLRASRLLRQLHYVPSFALSKKSKSAVVPTPAIMNQTLCGFGKSLSCSTARYCVANTYKKAFSSRWDK